MPFGLSAGTIAAIGAGVSVAGQVGSSLMAGSAASQAGSTEAGYSAQAAANQQAQYGLNSANQDPYIQTGQNDLAAYQNQYQNSNTALTSAFNNAQAAIPAAMTQANLVNTPGYQFNLQQGLQATQASAAARGLGVSGAALKGAANYSTGLANSTYQQQFANQQSLFGDASQQFTNQSQQQQLLGNQLQMVANTGETAATNLGGQNTTGANYTGQDLIGQGQQLGAGITGSAANYANALTGLGNSGVNGSAITNYLTGGSNTAGTGSGGNLDPYTGLSYMNP